MVSQIRLKIADGRHFAILLGAAVAFATAGLSCTEVSGPGVPKRSPASMLVVAGDAQQGTVGTELAAALVVRVSDSAGAPVPNQIVNFRVVSGGGSVFGGASETNDAGEARERWTLGTVAADSQRLEVRAVDATTGAAIVFATFRAAAVADVAFRLRKVSVDSGQAIVGSLVTSAPSVRVVDKFDNPVAGTAVEFAVTAGGGALTSSSQTSDGNGVATVGGWTLGTTAGPNTLTASSSGLSGSPLTFTATGAPGAATQLVLTVNAAGAASGVAFTTQPVVAVRDASGNLVTNDNSSVVTMTVSSGSSVVGTATATAAGGVVTFANVGISGVAGTSHTLTFGKGGLTSATQSITPSAGSASQLVVTTNAAGAASGLAFATQPVVAVRDAAGNPVTSDNSSIVTMTVSSGGTVVGAATATAASGVATFAGVGISGTAGTSFTLTFTRSGLSSASHSITPAPGAGSQLVVVTSAAGAGSGLPMTTQPVVAVRDASGNTVTSDNSSVVTMTVSTGATIVGTAAATASSGVATFTNVGISGTAGATYSLTFTKSGLTSAAQSILLSAGSGSQLVLVTSAAGAASGAPFTTQPVVAIRDAAGNTVTADNSSVVAMTVGSGGTVVGTGTATATSGVATFTGIGISGTAGTTYTLTFSKGGLASATQSITPAAGLASQLAVTTSAAGAASGLAFATQPVVAVRDAVGNTVTGDNSSIVTMTVSTGGTVVGAAIATASSGVATFAGVGISGTAGTSYTLTFSRSGLSSAAHSITPAPGAGSQLVVVTSAAGAGSGLPMTTQPVVAVRDASGNTVTSDNSSVVTMTVSTGATVVGTATATASNGVATFTNVGISGTAGATYTLTFSRSGLAPAALGISLSPGSGSQLVLVTSAAGAASGAAFRTQPAVAIRDATGNTVTADNSSVVTMTVSSGGTVVRTGTATVTSGVATFTGTGISGTAGTAYTLTFSKGGLTSATQSITAAAGLANQLAVTTNAAGAASGLAFTTQPVVAVRDAVGNTVTSDNSSIVTMTVSTGGTVAGAATATASSGVATFAGVGISGTAGASYTLTFSRSGLSSAAHSITPSPGAESQLVLVTTAAGAGSGLPMTTQPVVAVRDASDNTVTSDNSSVVTMTVSTGATVVGTAAATASNGVATFTNVGISGTAGTTYALTFTKSGLAAASQSIVPVPGTASQLVLAVNALDAPSGGVFTTQPVLTVRDATGNAVTNDSSSVVTMTVSAGATVAGTVSVTVSSGVATFSNAGISGTAGTNYTLTFGTPGLNPATQNITPRAGAATQLVLFTSAAGAPSDAPFTTQPAVAVRDAAGNTVTSVNNTVVTMTVSAGASVVGTATATIGGGTTTFTTVGIRGIAGTAYTLTFSANGLTSATQSIAMVPGTPSQIVLVTNAAGAAAGAAFTTQPVVVLRDPSGNLVTSDNASGVTMTVSAGATVVGVSSVTASGGVATFMNVGISGIAGTSYSLTFARSGLPAATQDITPVVGPVATVTVTPGTASVLTAQTRQLTAVLRDLAGNVSAATATWSSSNGAVATVSSTGLVTAVAVGTATITAMSNDRTGSSIISVSSPFTSVIAGWNRSCGLTSLGEAYCWGENHIGAIGDGTTVNRKTPTPVQGGLAFSALALSSESISCGLTTAGAAYCWGSGSAIGDGTTIGKTIPTAVQGGLVFTMLTVGNPHACGLTGSGAAYCWGNNNGQFADNSFARRNVPSAVAQGALVFTDLTAAGDDHFCGLTSPGAAFCWGENNLGQLGNGTTTRSTTPSAVQGGHAFVVLTSGVGHACGLTGAGAAYCWGYNGRGAIGDGTTTNRNVPTAVQGGHVFISLSAGGAHTCGLTSAGAAYCWGGNFYATLGDGTTTDRSTPVLVHGGLTFTMLSAGSINTCGLTSTGTAYCWGYNGDGEVGDGTLIDRLTPVPVIRP